MHNKLTIAALTMLLLLPPMANAAGRRRVAPSPSLLDDIVIMFVPVDGIAQPEAALLDVGAVRHDGSRSRNTIVTRTIGVRLTRRSGNGGTARLRAWLLHDDRNTAVRVDGITLTTTAQLIDPHAPLGIATRHRIEIAVPVTAPEGAIASTIEWEAQNE